jgi:hypothetical protein
MFVRFRPTERRLQVSVVETRRIDGKVRHEHVVSFGSVEVPSSIEDRIAFWQRVHERLAKLSSRLDAKAQTKLLSDIHTRIPMVTLDEQRALQLRNAEADDRCWTSIHDMHAATVEEHKHKVAEGQAEMAKAAAHRDAARGHIERLQRGDSERPPAIRAARYWLLNDTYVDLAVPYEKIGVPFEKISAGRTSPLSDDEKAKVIAELSKCEAAIRARNVDMLELVLDICSRCDIPAPVWLLPHVLEALNRFNPRTRQKRMQREIHQIRWAAVHHLRASRGLTWEAAYEAARRELSRTRARGSEETIRRSYQWMNRHALIKSMRQLGPAGEIDDFAREQYENRQATSERLISLESRHKKTDAPAELL